MTSIACEDSETYCVDVCVDSIVAGDEDSTLEVVTEEGTHPDCEQV